MRAADLAKLGLRGVQYHLDGTLKVVPRRAGNIVTDIYDEGRRSAIMRRIASRNTKPEVRVRSVLHKLGFRFRLHRKDLPGKPDIVLPRWRTVILVHGCFWHGHENCCEGHLPKTNSVYWAPKLARNRQRDIENTEKLQNLGWKRVVIWECETYSLGKIENRLRAELCEMSRRRQ